MAISNALMALPAHAEAGKIFDFNLTLPIMAGQFLLLMVFLDKFWFGPVGRVLDERDGYIREQLQKFKVGCMLHGHAHACLAAAAQNELHQSWGLRLHRQRFCGMARLSVASAAASFCPSRPLALKQEAVESMPLISMLSNPCNLRHRRGRYVNCSS